MYKIHKSKAILGTHLTSEGVMFGIYAREVNALILKIYSAKTRTLLGIYRLDAKDYRTGEIYHCMVTDVQEEDYYTWQVEKKGRISQPLIDPYAKAIEAIQDGSNTYYNIIVEIVPEEIKKPKITPEQRIIYELHVGAFTKNDKQLDCFKRGTFDGLIDKLDYLKSLGVTTLELLPIYKWNRKAPEQKDPITGGQMYDIWGYNPISFFAIEESYTHQQSAKHKIEAFRHFVRMVHQAGMEVVLDVVYNHTGEGGAGDTLFNFKQLGCDTYYKMDGHTFKNCAGTGNVLNTTHPIVKQLVVDSLKYWLVDIGVDGFRFDLASTLTQNEQGEWMAHNLLEDIAKDPILGSALLISESWDAKGSYDVGKMPYPFAEWNDQYRDTMRQFVRGDFNTIQKVVKGVEGRLIQFVDAKKNAWHSINFITAHDGFTMRDLVSYNEKHNISNGENNRDGNGINWSDNCGYEGHCTNEAICALREKRVKNYMILLMLSYGTPMILMGDEMGRTQHGNNNAYCQDNALFWVDWQMDTKRMRLKKFLQEAIRIRKSSKYLQHPENTTIIWHGVKCNEPDLGYYSRSIACEITCLDEHHYIIMNNYHDMLDFEMPRTLRGWQCRIDTSGKMRLGTYTHYVSEPYSIAVFSERH